MKHTWPVLVMSACFFPVAQAQTVTPDDDILAELKAQEASTEARMPVLPAMPAAHSNAGAGAVNPTHPWLRDAETIRMVSIVTAARPAGTHDAQARNAADALLLQIPLPAPLPILLLPDR